MKFLITGIKKITRDLALDRSLVRNLKKANRDEGFLYNQLMSGKITLQEYLLAK